MGKGRGAPLYFPEAGFQGFPKGGTVRVNFSRKLIVAPGSSVELKKWNPRDTLGYSHDHKTKNKLDTTLKRMDALQYIFFAEKKRALLVILQGMDAGGKDGTIRHVMTGITPQGCQVTSFKEPSELELAHDFLWRIHKAIPEKGMFGIFNRSQYEDVLVVRVHKLVPRSVWKERYDQINEFEKMLSENHVKILKFFLHISSEEQKKRLEERLTDPHKYWKISKADLAERKYWPDYVEAYEDAVSRCSTPWAPWYIIPADHKWFRNLAISRIMLETLEDFDMGIPQPSVDFKQLKKK
jgi:PPK2 family polyphosphate:nucleotide phosphotransferase